MSKAKANVETATAETVKGPKGRPVVANSARQARLVARAARVAAGGTVSKGRPSNPESKRQARLAEKAARIAAGEVIKAGRPKSAEPKAPKPKKVKAEVPAVEAPVEA